MSPSISQQHSWRYLISFRPVTRSEEDSNRGNSGILSDLGKAIATFENRPNLDNTSHWYTQDTTVKSSVALGTFFGIVAWHFHTSHKKKHQHPSRCQRWFCKYYILVSQWQCSKLSQESSELLFQMEQIHPRWDASLHSSRQVQPVSHSLSKSQLLQRSPTSQRPVVSFCFEPVTRIYG